MIARFLQGLRGLQVGDGSRSYPVEEVVSHCEQKTVTGRAVAVEFCDSRVSKQFVS